jgi:hypothetical protein
MIAEQEGDGEGALQARQDRGHGVLRRRSAFDFPGHQMSDDLRVGFAAELATIGDQLLAQRLEVLDDAVVDDRDRSDDVRMGIVDRRSAVRSPARVGDPDRAAERLAAQFPREIVELSLRAAPREIAVIDRANTGAVVAAIFKALEAVEQPLSNFTFADDFQQFRTFEQAFAKVCKEQAIRRLFASSSRENALPSRRLPFCSLRSTARLSALDVLGDHRSRPTIAPRRPSPGHQRAVRPDEGALADHRIVLAEPVVIAGDGAAPMFASAPILSHRRCRTKWLALAPGPSTAFFTSTKLPTFAFSPIFAPGRRRANGPMTAFVEMVAPSMWLNALMVAPSAISTPGPKTTCVRQ